MAFDFIFTESDEEHAMNTRLASSLVPANKRDPMRVESSARAAALSRLHVFACSGAHAALVSRHFRTLGGGGD